MMMKILIGEPKMIAIYIVYCNYFVEVFHFSLFLRILLENDARIIN